MKAIDETRELVEAAKLINAASSLDEKTIERAEQTVEALKHYYTGIAKEQVGDSRVRDAVAAYKDVLLATREVFGEERMTANVMIAAIEAGSYVGWRTIMGEKVPTVTAGGRRY